VLPSGFIVLLLGAAMNEYDSKAFICPFGLVGFIDIYLAFFARAFNAKGLSLRLLSDA
jgi:hypothetical protein